MNSIKGKSLNRCIAFVLLFFLLIQSIVSIPVYAENSSSEQANRKAPFDVSYVQAPPAANKINIADTFNFVGNTGVDSNYSNVAVVANDKDHTFGSMWAKEKLNLYEYFDTEMYLYMAHDSRNPDQSFSLADGMTFTLQNDPRGLSAIGSDGEGLGVYGSSYYQNYISTNPVTVIRNSAAIEFDLYRNKDRANSWVSDSSAMGDHYMYDPEDGTSTQGHCAVMIPKYPINGVRYKPANHVNNFNFEKSRSWVKLSVSWSPAWINGVLGGVLRYNYGGTEKACVISNVNNTFGGTQVYWGFTGSTGATTSVLAAAVTAWPEQAPTKIVTSEIGKDGSTVKKDEELEYTIGYENYSNSTQNITIKDTLPEGVDYVSSSNNGVYNPSDHTVTWTVSNAQSGDRGSVTLKVRVNDKAAVQIENSVVMKVGNNSEISSEPVINPVDPGDPQKEVTDENGQSVSAVKVGDELIYSIDYVNSLTGAATVVIKDKLPVGVDYISSTNGGTYNSTGHEVTWTLNNVASGERGTVQAKVKVNKDAVVKIDNVATVKVGDHDPRTSNKIETTVDSGDPVKKVTSTVGQSGSAVKVGDELVYSIEYVNYSTKSATVAIKDELPDGVDYISSSALGHYISQDHSANWVLNNVQSGTKGSVEVKVKVNEDAIVKIENDARVRVGNNNPRTSNKVVNPVDSGDPKKEVTDENGQTVSAVKVGDELIYTIDYINNLTKPATIVINDKLPKGVDYVSSTNGGSYNSTGHEVTWTLNNVASGTKGTVQVKVKVNEDAVVKIDNVATVKVGDHEPRTSNKVETEIDSGDPKKEVTSTAGQSGSAVKVGDELVYSVEYVNYSTKAATIVIKDKLPNGVDYVSSTNSGSYSSGNHEVTWTLANIASGAKGTVQVKVKVNEDAVVKIENDATVKVGSDDPRTSNKVVNPVDPGEPKKEVTDENGQTVSAVKVGDELIYTIDYINNLTKPATVVINDKLPKGVDYVSSTNSGSYNSTAHEVTWTFNNIASGTKGTVQVKVKVNEDAVVKIDNVATVKVGDHEPRTSNKVETEIDSGDPKKEVTSAAGQSGSAVKVGDELVYSIEYVNYSTKAATVVIKDKLPNGVDYVSSTNSGSYSSGNHEVTWTLANIASGAKGTVEVKVKVNEDAVVKIENTATVKVGDNEPNISNKVENPIDPGVPRKDVEGSAGQIIDSAKVGDELIYSVEYTNYTTKTATIVINDKLPKGVDYISSTNSGSYNSTGHEVSWTINDVTSGTKATVQVKVKVNEDAVVKIDNVASVKVGDHEPKISNKVETPIDPGEPKKEAKDTDGKIVNTAKVGDELIYSIEYVNNLTKTATVIIKDKLPVGVDYVSSTNGGSYDSTNHEVTWTLNNIFSGESGIVQVKVKVNEKAVVKIENTATVQVGNHDPRTSNKVETDIDSGDPKKEVTSTVGQDSSAVKVGDELVYSIEYINYSTKSATIVIKDKLPNGVDYVSSNNSGSYSSGNHEVTWTLANIASGAKGTVEVKVKVNEDAVVRIENVATVKVGSNDPRTSNTVENPVDPGEPKKEVTDENGQTVSAVKVGDELIYTIDYINNLTKPATVVIKDKLPKGVDYVSSTNGGSYNSTAHEVTWTLGNIASGAKGTVQVKVKVNEDAVVKIGNEATVQVGDHDPRTSNTVETEIDSGDPKKEVTSTIGQNGSAVKLGDELVYSIEYMNYSTKSATIVINDKLPKGVDYMSSTNSGSYSSTGHEVTWTLTNIASGAKGTVEVRVKVNEDAVVKIENAATVKVGSDDPRTSNTVENPIDPGNPKKEAKDVSGQTISAVKVGDELVYTINYVNNLTQTATIIIKDKLPAGVNYKSSTNNGTYNSAAHEVSWTLSNITSGGKGTVQVRVAVNENAVVKIDNTATVKVGDHDPRTSNKVEIPVTPTYTVNYDAGKGVTNARNIPQVSSRLAAGTEYTVSGNSPQPTRDGYTFNGWEVSDDKSGKLNSKYNPGDKFNMPENNVTLTAIWKSSNIGFIKEHVSYVIGYKDGRVKPNNNISRAEATTILFRLLDEETRGKHWAVANSFTDVKKGQWHNNAISTMSKAEIVMGYKNGTFMPNASITRAEYAAIVSRFDNDDYDARTDFKDIHGHWAEEDIMKVAAKGWMEGYPDGTFKPNDPISRAEVMTLVNRVLERMPENHDDLHPYMVTWPDNANRNKWYYLAVQEATNSHDHTIKENGIHEKWVAINPNPDWVALEKKWEAEYR